MDPRLLDYYNQELLHIRDGAAEFALEFPKVAGRLALDQKEGECADPYVERLLEGFAYLSARVQLKIEAEYPRFTQHLLEMLYPGLLSPSPSMALVKFEPDMNDPGLAQGFTLRRETMLNARQTPGVNTSCTFRTAHEVTFWPLEITEAHYYGHLPDLPQCVVLDAEVRGALKLRLRATAGLNFRQIALDRLPIYLSGNEVTAHRLYEEIFAQTAQILVLSGKRPVRCLASFGREALAALGFEDEQALFPVTQRGFDGYRLLREYSLFPARFLFAEITGLQRAFSQCDDDELEILFLFRRGDKVLEKSVNAENFSLYCTPAINLFPKRADRIQVEGRVFEHHVLPDRTRPLDLEVYEVTGVSGIGAGGVDDQQEFAPFYHLHEHAATRGQGFYSLRREPRVVSSSQRLRGARSSYLGTEVFLSLVDPGEAPYPGELKQLAITTLCTNRDLPLHMTVGDNSDFGLEVAAPVLGIRCLNGPTRPIQPMPLGEVPWRLISHLNLNYLSLIDSNEREGAAALRELLNLYGMDVHSAIHKQQEGIRSMRVRQIIRRMPTPGPIAFGRGLEIALTADERAFEGYGAFMLGAVLERFFARHASINAFTETVLHSTTRGEIMRWPARLGRRPIL